MNTRLTLAATSVLAILPLSAMAESVSLWGGVAANVAFSTNDGLDHLENTVEGYFGASKNGYYAGFWVGSLYQDATDDAEIDFFLGYANDINETFSYDISLTRIYLNNSGYQNDEISLDLSAAMSEAATGTLGFTLDPDAETLETTLGLEYALNDKVTLAGEIGHSEADDNMFGEISVSYGLTDQTGLTMLYEDSDTSSGILTFTVSYDFDVTGG